MSKHTLFLGDKIAAFCQFFHRSNNINFAKELAGTGLLDGCL
jgi:hypothetical protein